ncbi:MAG: TMEM165/GDT1 family protein [Anaerolineae bacterium]
MDWRVFLTTFSLIFLAEFCDKTQLAAVAMAARSGSPLAVFLGAALALALVTFLAVVFSQALLRIMPAVYVHKAAGLAFVAVGLFILWGKL